jgi:DNA polymerase-3 subunit delta'
MQTLIKTTNAYKLFQAEVSKGTYSHAYLIVMDAKRNLKNVLLSFAKVLYGCDNPYSPEEETLASRIENGTFSDCRIFPEEGKKFLVDDAELLTEECFLMPVESNKKVMMVCDFAEANTASQNKLLKLLEEPPFGVVFLLGATSAFSVLPTVLSRVSKLEIPPFRETDVASALKCAYPKGYTEEDFALCSVASGGSVGTAQTMLEGGEFRALIHDAFSLCLAGKDKLPLLTKKIGEAKRKKELLFLLRVIFRDATLIKGGLGAKGYTLLQAEQDNVVAVANAFSLSTLVYAQEKITQAEMDVYFNAVFPQCIELLFADLFAHQEKYRDL